MIVSVGWSSRRASRRRSVVGSVTLVFALLTGCAESTRVRTTPPGATLYVNDEFVGITPVQYKIDRSKWPSTFRYRLELDRYRTKEGEL